MKQNAYWFLCHDCGYNCPFCGGDDMEMSLDKAIAHGREHRKPYHGSKAIDRTCRNHGGCPWCEENRKHKFRDKHPEERDEQDGIS